MKSHEASMPESEDRVNISLARYEQILEDCRSAQDKVDFYRLILDRLGFPADVLERIVPGTIEVHANDYYHTLIPRTKYRIEFDAELYRKTI